MSKSILSANWHLTERCNYNCKFCFARNLGREITDLSTAEEILINLMSVGIEKINFVGGEPLLHPLIFDLIRVSKEYGFVTSMVSNGFYLNEENIGKLSPYLDWIGLSVDSSNEIIQRNLGRGCGNHIFNIKRVANLVHQRDMKLKINTTVTKMTYKEDMKSFIRELDPLRWKVFQVLPIKGQNEMYFDELKITNDQFNQFVQKNLNLELVDGNKPVFENNASMIDSYFMLGPDGSIINNRGMEYNAMPFDLSCKEDLLKFVDNQKYYARGGKYAW